jgi:hypothetical protein
MVCVKKRLLGFEKSAFEPESFLHQQADKLRNGNGRMRIVQLDRAMPRKRREIAALYAFITPYDILQRRAGKKILLFEPEALSLVGAVVRVEHASDILYGVLLPDRQRVFLLVKQRKIEFLNSLALPEAERADVIRFVAQYRHVVRNGKHILIREPHFDRPVVAPPCPGIALALPVVRFFDLITVSERLFKKAEFIPEPVSVERDIVRRRAVQKTSRKPSEAPVAERLILDVLHNGEVDPLLFQKPRDLVQYPKAVQIIEYHSAHKIFSAEIVGPSHFLMRAP